MTGETTLVQIRDVERSDLDRALLEERVLWRLHAMRRTLFIVSAQDGPMVEAAAGRDFAARERRKLEGWLSEEIPSARASRFVAALEGQVLDLLAGGSEFLMSEVSSAVPQLNMQLWVGSGKWRTRISLSSKLLFLMAMDGRLVRSEHRSSPSCRPLPADVEVGWPK